MPLTSQSADARATRRGQTLVLFALFLVVLIGSAALTIDYGTWLKSKRDYQNAADSAALQGATFLVKPIDATKQGQARLAAWNSLDRQLSLGLASATIAAWAASNNSAAQTSGGYRLWVSTSPNGAGAKYPGAQGTNRSAVFVYVEKDGSSFLGSVFGQGNPNVGAWATAAAGPNRFAVITLRKNGDPTNGNPTDIDVNGGTVLKVIDGDLGGNWGMSINGSGSKVQFSSTASPPRYVRSIPDRERPDRWQRLDPQPGRRWCGQPGAGQLHPGGTGPQLPCPMPHVLRRGLDMPRGSGGRGVPARCNDQPVR